MDKEFVALVTRHQALIYKVCHLYADDAAAVEDLFQEIVVNLWQAYPRFDGRAKVTTWMYRVALNTAITQLRRAGRRPRLQPFDARLAAPAALPDEQSRQLYAAIRQLNAVEKGLITLYLEGLSYREIGEALGITENNAGVRLTRIKEKLRRLVAAN